MKEMRKGNWCRRGIWADASKEIVGAGEFQGRISEDSIGGGPHLPEVGASP